MSFGSLPTDHLSYSYSDRSASSSIPSSTHQLLTVFQAAPLIYADPDGQYHPVRLFDFEDERQILTESLCDARIKIDLSFNVANVDRLGDFLARGEGRVLHFSCHGHPEYLAIENGWGAMQQLLVEDLRDWIQAGRQNLRFVFVSACYSRKAGEAFIQAGVPHVVCCQQEDQQIRNEAAVQFARAFYRALACGQLLSEAFGLGRQQVLNSLQIDRSQRQKEVAKFTLLPETGTNHNVRIFHEMPVRNTELRHSASSSFGAEWSENTGKHLPVPPQVFEGRQIDMYRVLEAMQSARLIRVTGSPGIGKCSVVQGLCRYLIDRNHVYAKEILWLPSPRVNDSFANEEEANIQKLQSQLTSVLSSFGPEEYEKSSQKAFNYIHNRKALLIIDARKIETRQMENVCSFLEGLMHYTVYAKVILIHHTGDVLPIKRLNCRESNVHIKPLDFESTVRLFGSLCQHVAGLRKHNITGPHDLCRLLIPEGSPTDKPVSKKSRDIFKKIGEGVPAQIHEAARSMSEEEFDRLLAIAARKDHQLEFRTRSALDKRLEEITTEINQAINSRNFMQAQDYQEQLDEMELLRESLPGLETLTSLAEGLRVDQELSIQARDFMAAENLQKELNALEGKIKAEKEAMVELGIQPMPNEIKPPQKESRTRAELEHHIMELEDQLQVASDENNFRKARSIDAQIIQLKEQRSSLPSRDALLVTVRQLRNNLKVAKQDHDWDEAESVYATLQNTELKVKAEMVAEARFRRNDVRETVDSEAQVPGAVAVDGIPTNNSSGSRHSPDHITSASDKVHNEKSKEREKEKHSGNIASNSARTDGEQDKKAVQRQRTPTPPRSSRAPLRAPQPPALTQTTLQQLKFRGPDEDEPSVPPQPKGPAIDLSATVSHSRSQPRPGSPGALPVSVAPVFSSSSGNEASFTDHSVLARMLQEHLSAITVEAEVVEVEPNKPKQKLEPNKPKQKLVKKLKGLFRRKKR